MAWQHAGLPQICMAVNLSARQFSDDGLLGDIAKVLRVRAHAFSSSAIAKLEAAGGGVEVIERS